MERRSITPKQRECLIRNNVPETVHDLLSSTSCGNLLTDIWNDVPNTIDPANNTEHRAIADKLVDLGFPPEMVLRFTLHTATAILTDSPGGWISLPWDTDPRPF